MYDGTLIYIYSLTHSLSPLLSLSPSHYLSSLSPTSTISLPPLSLYPPSWSSSPTLSHSQKIHLYPLLSLPLASNPLSLTHCIPLPLSPPLSPPFSLFLYLTPLPSLPLLSSLSLSLSTPLSVSLSLTLTHSLCLPLSPSHTLFLPLSPPPSLHCKEINGLDLDMSRPRPRPRHRNT
jgi:hypothetical protein